MDKINTKANKYIKMQQSQKLVNSEINENTFFLFYNIEREECAIKTRHNTDLNTFVRDIVYR